MPPITASIFGEEITLLLAGACIAWVSTVLTTLLTTFLNQWLAKRTSLAAKKEKLYYLTGKIAALPHDKPSEIIEAWFKEKDVLDKIVRKADEKDLDGLIGSVETYLKKSSPK